MTAVTSRISVGVGAAAVVGVCVTAGFAFGIVVAPLYHNRNFPWIIARASGIGAFIALAGLSVLGLLFRRPARSRGRLHPETLLRLHAALGPALCALLGAHIASLLADRYAGVTWRALLVPNAATYRPGAVTYGMFGAVLIVLIAVTAGLAGRWGVGARWSLVHRLAYPAFALAWTHGVLAGSDTPALKALYVAGGVAVGLAALPRLYRESAVRSRAVK